MKFMVKLGTIFIFTVYLYLRCCGILYVGESITPVNVRMNIHWKVKSCSEHSINHYKSVCKGASSSIHILEKLEGDGFMNGRRDFSVQKLPLQRKGYWMKKLRTIYPYALNERAKNSKLEQPTGKLFPPLPRFSNRCENLDKRPVNEPTKFDTTDTLLAHMATFPLNNRSKNFRRILEELKRKDLKKVGIKCNWWVKNMWCD